MKIKYTLAELLEKPSKAHIHFWLYQFPLTLFKGGIVTTLGYVFMPLVGEIAPILIFGAACYWSISKLIDGISSYGKFVRMGKGDK